MKEEKWMSEAMAQDRELIQGPFTSYFRETCMKGIYLLVVGLIVGIVGIWYTFSFYQSCDGQVVRGVFGLICLTK